MSGLCGRMNVDPYTSHLTQVCKNKFKMDLFIYLLISKWIYLDLRAKSIKFLDENIGVNLCGLGLMLSYIRY